MDLESECSALESVEDNEVITPESLGNVSETKIENNGTCFVEHVDDKLFHDSKVEGIGVNSPSLTVQPPGGSRGSSPPAATKGYGLKKWRRIRRESSKEGGSNLDSSKMLKRGLPNSVGNSRRPLILSGETKPKSEGSVSSTNTIVKVLGNALDGIAINNDSGMVGGSIFAAGTDSENSEDRSSKSSTAASAPRLRHEIPAAVGYGRDKNRLRSLNGKNLGNSVQRGGLQGKIRIETSKKARGDRVKIEKENSHSSLESDSRSSNFVFMQGTNSMTSNGRQSGRPANYDGENSDEAQDGEQNFSEEIQTKFSKNEAESEDASQEDLAAELSWKIKEEKSENHESSMDRDALVESIITLECAQEALEKEIQKLRCIGEEDTLFFDDSVQTDSLPSEFTFGDPEVHKPSSSEQFQSGESRPSSPSLEIQMIGLKQNVIYLQSKLEEARVMLELKEAKVVELEATLTSSKSPMEEMGSNVDMQQENYRDVETELEGLFKQKIEAEIEYLAITRTIQKVKVAAVDQITLLEEQKTLASEQVQVLNKLEDAESKATMLKRQAEKLETYCGEIVESDEVLKLQNRVCKFTLCFSIQLILLVIVLGLIVLQLSPHYGEVLPT